MRLAMAAVSTAFAAFGKLFRACLKIPRGAVFCENPPGGGSFARGRRWLGRYSPRWGCAGLAALAPAKIPRRSTPRNFQTGSLGWPTPLVRKVTDGEHKEEKIAQKRNIDILIKCIRSLYDIGSFTGPSVCALCANEKGAMTEFMTFSGDDSFCRVLPEECGVPINELAS